MQMHNSEAYRYVATQQAAIRNTISLVIDFLCVAFAPSRICGEGFTTYTISMDRP